MRHLLLRQSALYTTHTTNLFYEEEKVGMASIPPKALSALRGPILSILRKSDLSSISAKQVRVALANTPADAMQGDVGSDVAGPRLLPRLGINIDEKAHKKAIDGLIKECFDTINEEIANA